MTWTRHHPCMHVRPTMRHTCCTKLHRTFVFLLITELANYACHITWCWSFAKFALLCFHVDCFSPFFMNHLHDAWKGPGTTLSEGRNPSWRFFFSSFFFFLDAQLLFTCKMPISAFCVCVRISKFSSHLFTHSPKKAWLVMNVLLCELIYAAGNRKCDMFVWGGLWGQGRSFFDCWCVVSNSST